MNIGHISFCAIESFIYSCCFKESLINPTLQMGLMKLIASPDELRQLSMTHVESNNTHEVNFNAAEVFKFKE